MWGREESTEILFDFNQAARTTEGIGAGRAGDVIQAKGFNPTLKPRRKKAAPVILLNTKL